jgi:hypothetical protein
MANHEMRVVIGKMKVAQVGGSDFKSVEGQALHYAMQYREEGDVTIQRQVRTGGSCGKLRWKRHAFFAAI